MMSLHIMLICMIAIRGAGTFIMVIWGVIGDLGASFMLCVENFELNICSTN